MSGADGVKGAVVGAIEAAAGDLERARAAEAAAQLELLPPSRFEPGSTSHNQALEKIKRLGVGRPAGAQNKATREVKDLVRRLFGDPMVESARYLLHTPETLARELSCPIAEAFDRLERIRADLRRYFYAPLAAVDGDGNAVAPVLNMTFGNGSGPAGGGKPWEYLDVTPSPETQQNQALSQSADDVSHAEQSQAEPKCPE